MKCKRVSHRSMLAIGAVAAPRRASPTPTHRRVGPVLPYFCLGSVLLFAHVAFGTNVNPGHDLFVTGEGSSHDFSQTPLPTDFFGPGSDPFTRNVPLEGNPLGTFQGFTVGNTDTIVRRVEVAVLPNGTGESDTINIEVVALSLRSVTPITVTFNGGQNPELWDLKVTLSPATGSGGMMTITHSDSEGGTYTADMDVVPLLTFTRVGGGGMAQLDGADIGYHADVTTSGAPQWRHEPTGQLVVPGLTNDFYIFGEPGGGGLQGCELAATWAAVGHVGPHPVVCATATPPPIPTVSEWALVVMTLIVFVAGTIFYGRRKVIGA